MSETAFEKWWETAEASTQREAAFLAWRAALEWAAGQVEAAGCVCVALNSAEEHDREYCALPGFTFKGKMDFRLDDPVVEHDYRCPVALAAKIRRS